MKCWRKIETPARLTKSDFFHPVIHCVCFILLNPGQSIYSTLSPETSLRILRRTLRNARGEKQSDCKSATIKKPMCWLFTKFKWNNYRVSDCVFKSEIEYLRRISRKLREPFGKFTGARDFNVKFRFKLNDELNLQWYIILCTSV